MIQEDKIIELLKFLGTLDEKEILEGNKLLKFYKIIKGTELDELFKDLEKSGVSGLLIKLEASSDHKSMLAIKDNFKHYIKILYLNIDKKKIIHLINWKMIYEIFKNEFEKLYNKLVEPKKTEDMIANKFIFKLYVLGLIVPHIYMGLLIIIMNKKLNKTTSVDYINNFIKKEITASLRNCFLTLDIQQDLSNMNIEELKMKAKQGEKFLGKSFLNVEVEAFDIIFQKYEDAKSKDSKMSYRTIAFNVARNELGYEHKSEKDKFYKRFLTYKNKSEK